MWVFLRIFSCTLANPLHSIPVTAAALVSVDFDPATRLVSYRWTQYQITTTVAGQTSTVAIAAMTRDDAAAYARTAREGLSSLALFEGMKLSLVNRTYVERLDAYDPGEDGDGSLHVSATLISGERWSRHSPRSFGEESHAAETACAALADYYTECGW